MPSDWTAHQDDDGQTYYHNSETGESTWETPAGFTEDSEQDNSDPPADDGITQSPIHDDAFTQSPTYDARASDEGDAAADREEIGQGWFAYKDDEGRVYYYNTDSGETQWDKPDLNSVAKEEKPDIDRTTVEDSGNYSDAVSNSGDTEVDEPKEGDSTEDAPPDDPESIASQQKGDPTTIARNFLQEPDAIIEPQVLDHISTLVTEMGPQEAGRIAMTSLIHGYQGVTAMCGLMGLWLAELKASGAFDHGGAGTNSSAPSLPTNGVRSREEPFHRGADAARDVVEDVLNRLAKERFTRDGGDAIMSLSKKQVAFVDAMIASERWRNLLIDLSASNPDNKLFMYCLQSISNLGHHRAITKRINQSDYFGVFNSILSAELALIGKIAVDGFSKSVTDSIDTSKGQMETSIDDLCRTCTSSSCTYLYANELLNELIQRSRNHTSTDGTALKGAVRKWERFQEQLEQVMLKATGTTFQRKRRIDVTLAMSDLVQRQRRRIYPMTSTSEISKSSSKLILADNLDTAIATLLTKCCLGNPIDKECVENILKYAYGGSVDRIGDLLIQHPLAVSFLLRNMFGIKRLRQLELRQKCARLVALAVLASERNACVNDEVEISSSDEEVLCQVLLKGSQLCEQVESMVSFVALDNDEFTDGSVGMQLSAMCIKYSVISQGVLIWANELAHGPEFVNTAGYPTLSPCILSLARLIGIHHPLARPAVLGLSLIFLGHSNREISHQKMQSIKEQCLRLMIWLSAQGMALTVLSAIQGKIQKGGSSELDASLVRYFISGLLSIMQPPFSIPFVRALSGLLTERPCIDALTSQLFEAQHRSELTRLIVQFEEAFRSKGCSPLGDEAPLLSYLKTIYD